MFLVHCLLVVWSAQSFVRAECPNIITHKEWDGIPVKNRHILGIPLDLVIVEHTVTESCSDDKSCAEIVRNLQKTHIEKSKLWDISSSFLIGNNGKIYEGRGWFRVGVHTPGYNNQSYSIAFIGRFENEEPSRQALDAAKSLIECAVEKQHLSADYAVVAHKQLVNTESPGMKTVNKIMSWPHWLADVTEIKKRIETILEPSTAPPQARTLDNDNTGVILKTSDDIDTLTNMRNVLSELIENLRKLALQVFDTAAALDKGLKKQVEIFFKQFLNNMKMLRDLVNAALPKAPAFNKAISECHDSTRRDIEKRFDDTEKQVQACSDKRASDIEAMIKDLKELSLSTTEFARDAEDATRNCTEHNLGIKEPTKICFNSKTRETASQSSAMQRRTTLLISRIQAAVANFPEVMKACTKNPVLDATTEANNVAAKAATCSAVGTFRGPFGFGF